MVGGGILRPPCISRPTSLGFPSLPSPILGIEFCCGHIAPLELLPPAWGAPHPPPGHQHPSHVQPPTSRARATRIRRGNGLLPWRRHPRPGPPGRRSRWSAGGWKGSRARSPRRAPDGPAVRAAPGEEGSRRKDRVRERTAPLGSETLGVSGRRPDADRRAGRELGGRREDAVGTVAVAHTRLPSRAPTCKSMSDKLQVSESRQPEAQGPPPTGGPAQNVEGGPEAAAGRARGARAPGTPGSAPPAPRPPALRGHLIDARTYESQDGEAEHQFRAQRPPWASLHHLSTRQATHSLQTGLSPRLESPHNPLAQMPRGPCRGGTRDAPGPRRLRVAAFAAESGRPAVVPAGAGTHRQAGNGTHARWPRRRPRRSAAGRLHTRTHPGLRTLGSGAPNWASRAGHRRALATHPRAAPGS